MGVSENPSADEPEGAAEEPAPNAPAPKKRFEQAQGWIGTLVGVVALGLSIYNLLALQQEPAVEPSPPQMIPIASDLRLVPVVAQAPASRERFSDSVMWKR
ncbi:hypothetical protein ACFWAP_26745 [Streptomyces goshikiensis]|uniref:hypothetical protein n=1 Tax=Streptomyces goshikiensis TaxID=1942 RepID=UPI00364C9D81